MKPRIRCIQNIAIICFQEDILSVDNAHELRAAVREAFENNTHGIVIDLSQLKSIHSNGLCTIVALSKEIRNRKIIRVAGLNEHLWEVFGRIRLERILALYHTLEEALFDLLLDPQTQTAPADLDSVADCFREMAGYLFTPASNMILTVSHH